MILISPERLSDVIGSIYEAIYDPATWPAAITNLNTLFHGSKACFARIGPELQPSDIVTTHFDPIFLRRYFEEYADQPNILRKALDAAPARTVYSDHALVGRGRLRRTRLWNEWMTPQDMYGGIGCKVLESGASYWYFDVQRGRRQAGFESNEVELLQTIVPHLTRAAEIRRQFQSTQILASTFDRLPFGVILIDGFMRIASLNPAAELILTRADSALVSKSGHLVAADAAAMASLRQLVAQACSIREGVVPGVGGDLLLRGKRGVDLTISIVPFHYPMHQLPFVGRHAAIFVRELSLNLPSGFAEQVRTLFALSPREANLAASLASGRTLKEAADDNQIQLSTARSYLEIIFRKTGVRQQSQLVALLKSVQPLIR